MNIEKIRKMCLALPHVTEDMKWGHDLCFCIGEKMFVVLGVDNVPVSASFKVKDEEFEEMSNRKVFSPRLMLQDINGFTPLILKT